MNLYYNDIIFLRMNKNHGNEIRFVLQKPFAGAFSKEKQISKATNFWWLIFITMNESLLSSTVSPRKFQFRPDFKRGSLITKYY